LVEENIIGDGGKKSKRNYFVAPIQKIQQINKDQRKELNYSLFVGYIKNVFLNPIEEKKEKEEELTKIQKYLYIPLALLIYYIDVF
jgi:predicted transcriptional regulator